LALVLVAAPALAHGEEEQQLGPTSGERLVDEAVKVTKSNWWDRANRDKIDWKGLVERYREQAKKAATPLEAHHVVNELLGELKREVRHAKGGKIETIVFVPTEVCLLDGTKASVRIIEKDGKKLGVIHLWHFMNSDMNAALKKAIKGPLAECDGLVLDVRGRG